MELPTHPEADDPPTSARPAEPSRRWSRLLVGVLLGLVAVIVLLHLTGVVGPGGS
jgi:hypothetical protein